MSKVRHIGWFFALGAFAALVLGAAAVWLGSLNHDEGWYLYAANLVKEGKMPYRDFFYTQGPLFPIVYSALTPVWESFGLLGARILGLLLALAGIVIASQLAARSVPAEKKSLAAAVVFLSLGSNLYHLYYLAIPKTYALASLFVVMGFFFLSFASDAGRSRVASFLFSLFSGASLAFASGTRISLGILLCVCGFWLLVTRRYLPLFGFCVGGFGALALVYGPFLLDAGALKGLVAAQRYHTSRGGFDIVWTVGSFSRLVRWYLPLFVIAGLSVSCVLMSSRRAAAARTLKRDSLNMALLSGVGFMAVFFVQMLAPFPYEDYQVPVMGLFAVSAGTAFASTLSPRRSEMGLLLVLGMCWACSFGSPLLEKWTTNGQDRFWTLKKNKFELAQLRDVAKRIEELDPGGKELFTQDIYLAIETRRKVPVGLEMGPFSILSDNQWRELISSAPCKMAAFSGYAFAIEPPECSERPVSTQMKYWQLLKEKYDLVDREEMFGQNATTLLTLKRKEEAARK